MTEYVPSALFVHTADTRTLFARFEDHPAGIPVTPIDFDTLTSDPDPVLKDAGHVVVAVPLDKIKAVLELAVKHGFSVGLLPMAGQRELIRFYDLPRDPAAAVDLALRAESRVMDLICCNGKIMLFKATIGRMPLLDSAVEIGKRTILSKGLRRFFRLRLLKFDFKTAADRRVSTAASGCMILQHHKGSLASRLISGDSSVSDGSVSTVISAPISVFEYLKFLVQLTTPWIRRRRLPDSIGYLKSPRIDIEPETPLEVVIDGDSRSQTPLCCEAIPGAVRINVGPGLQDDSVQSAPTRERIEVDSLPRGKELVKARRNKTIPFFSYASEERFHDLFSALRDDARIDGIYLVLMVLSTMLATVGLYLNSASVIIGAMLLAPLMAPIVSLAMGLLRGDNGMTRHSLAKIFVGMFIALMASAVVSFLFPDEPVTAEMQARLNPTLLDLAVAVLSGVAAAYSKSFKEIIQSLAGVAIAVALVPPLAVAGTGLGRMELHFFAQAFLLFSTNLIGIVLAAVFTFRLLGFSPVIRSKRGMGLVLALMVGIAFPLYASYERIVETRVMEKSWQRERFLVNGKYIIVQKADLVRQGEKNVLFMDIMVREPIDRRDLNELKRKIEFNFNKRLIIRAQTIYIP